jgi:type VI secretion system protein ImpC
MSLPESKVCAGMRRALPSFSEADALCLRVDQMIARVDRLIFETVTTVLHAPQFRSLESSWRGLWYLANQAGNSSLVGVVILSVSKEDLAADFDDAAGLDQSGLYDHLYRNEYDYFAGEPYGAILLDYGFHNTPADLRLLESLAQIGMHIHAPFVGSVTPVFFGLRSWAELPGIPDMSDLFELSEYAKWRSFQAKDYSRYMVLMLNGFLVRLPYRGAPFHALETALTYDESRWDSEGQGYLFASPVYGLGAVLARAFLRTGWCTDIYGGSEGGLLEGVPVAGFEYGTGAGNKITTELLITDRLEKQLAEQGFLPLAHHRGMEAPCLFSSRTVQESRQFPGGPVETGSWTITSRLPYVMLASRIAHYLKAHQRRNLGNLTEAREIQSELQKWFNENLVAEESYVAMARRRRYPLRKARVVVKEIPETPGRLRVDIILQPHFQLEDVTVDLHCATTFTVSRGG